MTQNILFVGNPGAGKSALLNSLIGQTVFKSGISFGTGLTDKLDIKEVDGNRYMDTPGLDDEEKRQQAAIAIAEALRKEGWYKLFFVFRLEMGRARTADCQLLQVVLEAIDTEEPVPFYVIFNQASKMEYRELSDTQKGHELMHNYFLKGLDSNKSSGFQEQLFIPRLDSLDGVENALLPADEHHWKDLMKFVDGAKCAKIPASIVKDLDIQDWGKKVKSLEKRLAVQGEEFAKVLKEVERQQAETDKRCQEMMAEVDGRKAASELQQQQQELDIKQQQERISFLNRLFEQRRKEKESKKTQKLLQSMPHRVVVRESASTAPATVGTLLMQLGSYKTKEQEQAAARLRQLSDNPDFPKLISERNGIQDLVRALTGQCSLRTKKKVCHVLWQLARHDMSSMHTIADIGRAHLAITSLVNVLKKTRKEDVAIEAALLLFTVSSIPVYVPVMINAGCIPPLVKLLQDCRSDSASAAAMAALSGLTNLTNVRAEQRHMCLETLRRSGVVDSIVPDILETGTPDTKAYACKLLAALCWLNQDCQRDLLQAGSIRPLTTLLRDGHVEVQEGAALTLAHMAHDMEASHKIAMAGAVPSLVDLLKTANGRAAAAAQAVMALARVSIGKTIILKRDPRPDLLRMLPMNDRLSIRNVFAAGALCVLHDPTSWNSDWMQVLLNAVRCARDDSVADRALAAMGLVASASSTHREALLTMGCDSLATAWLDNDNTRQAAAVLVTVLQSPLQVRGAISSVSSKAATSGNVAATQLRSYNAQRERASTVASSSANGARRASYNMPGQTAGPRNAAQQMGRSRQILNRLPDAGSLVPRGQAVSNHTAESRRSRCEQPQGVADMCVNGARIPAAGCSGGDTRSSPSAIVPQEQQQLFTVSSNVSQQLLQELSGQDQRRRIFIKVVDAVASVDPFKLAPILAGVLQEVITMCGDVAICRIQAARLQQRLEALKPFLVVLERVIGALPADTFIQQLLPCGSQLYGVLVAAQQLLRQLPQKAEGVVDFVKIMLGASDMKVQFETVNAALTQACQDVNTCIGICHLHSTVKLVQDTKAWSREDAADLREDMYNLGHHITELFQSGMKELKTEMAREHMDLKVWICSFLQAQVPEQMASELAEMQKANLETILAVIEMEHQVGHQMKHQMEQQMEQQMEHRVQNQMEHRVV